MKAEGLRWRISMETADTLMEAVHGSRPVGTVIQLMRGDFS
jgi:hypothetical protein